MYTDYTVDLETMDIRSTAAILSIGAAAFDRTWEEFDSNKCALFYINIDLQDCMNHGLTVGADTIMWWLEQSDAARSAFEEPPRVTLQKSLNMFTTWVNQVGPTVPCWTHATFDAPILANAFARMNMKIPTPYRKQRDIRTLYDLKGHYDVPRIGTHHNALDDAIYQAHYIWGMLNSE